MENLIVFDDHEIGYIHSIKGYPCEDYSGNISTNEYKVIAVSDGHGDPSCFRSSIGAQKAVEITLGVFQEFAESFYGKNANNSNIEDSDNVNINTRFLTIQEAMLSSSEQRIAIKRLINTILSRWSKEVQKHYYTNPIKEEEKQLRNDYPLNDNIEHIYGCTLLGSLWIQDYLIVIQQGDGRCFIQFDDDSFCEPVPWDETCHDNITTSLCDRNASDTMRYYVSDIRKMNQMIAGVYLCSDGIDKSFSAVTGFENETEGSHNYIRRILLELIEKETIVDFKAWLSSDLLDVSRKRSGDDMSLAGIVNICLVKRFKENFETQITIYNLKEKLQLYEDKYHSMQRKHDFLKKKKSKKEAEHNSIKKKLTAEKKRLQLVQDIISNLEADKIDIQNEYTLINNSIHELISFRGHNPATAKYWSDLFVSNPTLVKAFKRRINFLLNKVNGECQSLSKEIKKRRNILKRKKYQSAIMRTMHSSLEEAIQNEKLHSMQHKGLLSNIYPFDSYVRNLLQTSLQLDYPDSLFSLNHTGGIWQDYELCGPVFQKDMGPKSLIILQNELQEKQFERNRLIDILKLADNLNHQNANNIGLYLSSNSELYDSMLDEINLYIRELKSRHEETSYNIKERRLESESHKQKVNDLQLKLDTINKQLEEAKTKYSQYDMSYREIEEEIQQITDQLRMND